MYTALYRDNVQHAVNIWLAQCTQCNSVVLRLWEEIVSKSVCACPSTAVPSARYICILVFLAYVLMRSVPLCHTIEHQIINSQFLSQTLLLYPARGEQLIQQRFNLIMHQRSLISTQRKIRETDKKNHRLPKMVQGYILFLTF